MLFVFRKGLNSESDNLFDQKESLNPNFKPSEVILKVKIKFKN